jgi:hypothetical protein
MNLIQHFTATAGSVSSAVDSIAGLMGSDVMDMEQHFNTSEGSPSEAVGSPTHRIVPPTPSSVEETGLRLDLMVQLLVKTMYFATELTEASAAKRLKLPYVVVEELFRVLRADKLCEVKGTSGARGILYRYTLTDLGIERARQYLEVNQYVGPAPVPLAQYEVMTRRQSVSTVRINQDVMRRGLSHLVLEPETIERVGEAVNSGKPLFLYGKPGNGKTVIAEAIGEMMGNLAGGEIYIPYCVEIDNQIIQMYDPVTHTAVEDVDEEEYTNGLSGINTNGDHDARWVLCKRPLVFVGGELTLKMLDLSFDPVTKFYQAPPQVKANGGVFIIDDFGRQLVRPRDLLNRWIVPLEKGVDYLTLHTGKKFRVPFDTIVVFATNIEPSKLADEAFLRRIRNKVYIDNPTLEGYTKLFRYLCEKYGVVFDPSAIDYLWREYYQKYGFELRSCQPRDIIEQLISIARYMQIRPTLAPELLDRVCHNYFLLDQQQVSGTLAQEQEEAGWESEAEG